MKNKIKYIFLFHQNLEIFIVTIPAFLTLNSMGILLKTLNNFITLQPNLSSNKLFFYRFMNNLFKSFQFDCGLGFFNFYH